MITLLLAVVACAFSLAAFLSSNYWLLIPSSVITVIICTTDTVIRRLFIVIMNRHPTTREYDEIVNYLLYGEKPS